MTELKRQSANFKTNLYVIVSFKQTVASDKKLLCVDEKQIKDFGQNMYSDAEP